MDYTYGTHYGQISPRTAAYVVKDLLERGTPYLVFEKFGQAKPIPSNSTQSIKFRRYFLETSGVGSLDGTDPYALASWQNDTTQDYTPYKYYEGTGNQFDPSNKTLTEGTTPNATKLASEDITASLTQYGDLVTISDVIMDTHEDPVLSEATEILAEQAAVLAENIRFNVLKAGSNVFYANGSARANVNSVLTLNLQRQITRSLKRNLAKPITKIVRSTAAYGTEAIAPSFVAICHPDCEPDIRGLSGFVPAERYGSMTPWVGEIGKVEDVRYISSTIVSSFGAVGADASGILKSGSNAYVYPILYLAANAYGLVPLKGKSSITPMVVNPVPSDSDPLAQRGHVGFKFWQTCIILSDFWLGRAEVAVSDLA